MISYKGKDKGSAKKGRHSKTKGNLVGTTFDLYYLLNYRLSLKMPNFEI